MELDSVAEEKATLERSKKMLLYVAIFSIIMLFAGLTSAYIVSMSGGFWVEVSMPKGFYWSTGVLLLCSLTMFLSKKSLLGGNITRSKTLVIVTFLLGIAFTALQFRSWNQLIEKGNYLSSGMSQLKGEYGTDYTFFYEGETLEKVDGEFYAPSDVLHEKPLANKLMGSRNTASSYIYLLSGVHWLHLIGGLLYLLLVLNKFRKQKLDENNSLAVSQAATYWHFLDALWVYLFLFLLFIH